MFVFGKTSSKSIYIDIEATKDFREVPERKVRKKSERKESRPQNKCFLS